MRLVCPDGDVSTTFAFTASWPSRKTVAAMVNVSPTAALAGYAPASTVGVTSVIGMRPVMAWMNSLCLNPVGTTGLTLSVPSSRL